MLRPFYRLALEKGIAGARYHALAEEGVPVRQIAEAIGRGLKIPVAAKSPSKPLVILAGLASSPGWTRRRQAR